MSKSLGNLILVRDLLREHSASAIRLYLLSHHYHEGWEFEVEAIGRCDELARRIEAASASDGAHGAGEDPFFAALGDDLDTPRALALLTERLEQAEAGDDQAAQSLAAYRGLLGI
jgi:cysteinyl-tRNA synthetase